MTKLLGLGAGWRPELAWPIEQRPDLGFVEVVAENLPPHGPLPTALQRLRARGVQVIPHGVSLGLGGAERPDPAQLATLAKHALACDAPCVSEHLAFVRGGGLEAGHLLPLPRTMATVRILAENIRIAQDALPVPLAVENIAAGFRWPEDEMTEEDFLYEVLVASDAQLLLDTSNLWANAANHGVKAERVLARIPSERVAYCHVGGGVQRGPFYHDTHADPLSDEVLKLVARCAERLRPPGIMLEVDDNFPTAAEWNREMDEIAAAWQRSVPAS